MESLNAYGNSTLIEDAPVCVVTFHDAIAAGRPEAAAEVFGFAAAHEYWRTITTALGVGCPDPGDFRRTVIEILGDVEVRKELSSSILAPSGCRVIGSTGAVVFTLRTVPGESRTGVATVALEEGAWKVRTYPGVFPGRLLAQAKGLAAGIRDRGVREK